MLLVDPNEVLPVRGRGKKRSYPANEEEKRARKRESVSRSREKKKVTCQKSQHILAQLEEQYRELFFAEVEALYVERELVHLPYEDAEYAKSNAKRILKGKAAFDPKDCRHERRENATEPIAKARKTESDTKSQWKLGCRKRANDQLTKDKIETLHYLIADKEELRIVKILSNDGLALDVKTDD